MPALYMYIGLRDLWDVTWGLADNPTEFEKVFCTRHLEVPLQPTYELALEDPMAVLNQTCGPDPSTRIPFEYLVPTASSLYKADTMSPTLLPSGASQLLVHPSYKEVLGIAEGRNRYWKDHFAQGKNEEYVSDPERNIVVTGTPGIGMYCIFRKPSTGYH